MINVLILIYILIMIYWWGSEGFFSATLHLACVILAGALALAIWEPLVHGFLLSRMPAYAVGVGLIAPFILLIMLLRFAFGLAAPNTVFFHSTVNFIIGSVMGFFAAILTAGFTVIALGFLPGPVAMAGYQPLVINTDGAIARSDSRLWVPVDRIADQFFSTLSNAGFYSGTPISVYYPDLHLASHRTRLKLDLNASAIASPNLVSIANVASQPAPATGIDDAVIRAAGPDARVGGHKILAIQTEWNLSNAGKGTLDVDSTLRLYPSQIQLITRDNSTAGGGAVKSHRAFGAVKSAKHLIRRDFVPFTTDTASITGDTRDMTLHLGFVIDDKEEMLYLVVRNLRIDLRDPRIEQPTTITAFNTSVAPAPVAQGGSDAAIKSIGQRTGLVSDQELVLTDRLPMDISLNSVGALDVRKNKIVSGLADIRRQETVIPQSVRVNSFFIAQHQSCVRLTLTRAKAQSLLGAAVSQAASLGTISITDANGDSYLAAGYVWNRTDGSSEVRFMPDDLLRNARQLPISKMTNQELIRLYFVVPRNIKITTLKMGAEQQEVNLLVP